MKQILGIDFGEKRIGLALSDPEGQFAVPLETVRRTSDAQAIRQIIDTALDRESRSSFGSGFQLCAQARRRVRPACRDDG